MQYINIRLLVSNIQASITFWRDILGLRATYSDETLGYAYFETGSEPGSAGIELLHREAFAAALGEPAPPPAAGARPAVLVFRVDNVDTAYADFIQRGATAVAPPQDRPAWNARAAHLSDPDGYLVEIYTPLAPAPAPTT